MEFVITMIVMFTCILAVQLILIKIGRNFMNKLSTALFINNDINEYCSLLNSFKGRIFFNNDSRKLMEIDANIYVGNDDNAEELFKELNNKKIKKFTRLMLYKKELDYYVDRKKYDLATTSYNDLISLASNIKHNNMESIIEESECVYQIYVLKNHEYLDKMLKKAEESEGHYKGIYLYRASKCYYYNHEDLKARETLVLALDYLKDTEWESHVDKCITDLSLLDEK